MNTIILNSTHRDGASNSRFIYNFPSITKFEKGDTIGVASISMNNSIFNVESTRNNNKFSIIWNADTSVQYDFTMPDNFYDIAAINGYIQYVCVQNNLYCINSSGQNVYFVELSTNSSSNGTELRCYALPDAAEATILGHTKPVDAAWEFHAIFDQTPQFVVSSNGFGALFGFIAGTYPPSIESTSQYIPNTLPPQISVVNSLILTCNLINSELSNPVNTFYSMPLSGAYGSLMITSNASRIDIPIYEGSYKNVTLEFFDQFFQSIKMNNFEVVINLVINRHYSKN